MMVLPLLHRALAAELHCLIPAEMHARETRLAPLAAMRLAAVHRYVAHGTDLGTNAASDALLGINPWAQSLEHRLVEQRLHRRQQVVTAEVPGIHAIGYVALDALQARGVLLELPRLLVGVASESQRAVVRHAYLVAIVQPYALLLEYAVDGPDTVASQRSAWYHDEVIRPGRQFQLLHEPRHNLWRIAVVARIYEADALLAHEVGLQSIAQRHNTVASALRYLPCRSEAITCA